jgi:hypothetical protein
MVLSSDFSGVLLLIASCSIDDWYEVSLIYEIM